MSTEINNQVVQMKFNNREFEKNVQQTLTSLEKLDESLQFKDGGKGFDTLSKAAEEVKVKFSALEVVAISALNNITNKAINAGEKLVRSLSVDNIAAGWQKFEDITTSTGTLFNQGFDMVEIEDQLSRITFFADETSYSLTDMVSNLAKFTSKGTDLKVATRAVEGISLLASTAGKNAADASAVMYQLAQVSNYVKLQDWNSVVMRNMNTLEFQKVIVETAKAAHTLQEETDGLYKTISGKKYSMKDLFTSGLSEGWFTYDVLINSTSKYASAVDDLYDKLQDDKSIETASEAIAKYGDQLDAFGIKAFKAGQEARTWTDVINSVKDAVSSKWQTTFKMILGDYQEARDLFTGLANMLYDAFAAGGDERNDILALWKGLGGREKLLDGLAAGFFAIKDAVDAVKNAFYEIFSSLDRTTRIGNKADKLLSITESFRKTMYSIANFVNRNAGNITSFFKGIFSVIKLITDSVTGLFHALIPATKSSGSLFQIILSLAGAVGKVLSYFTEWIRQSNILATVMNVLKGIMTVVGNLIILIASGIMRLASYIREFVKAVAKLRPIQTVVRGLSYAFAVVAASVMSLIENIKQLIITLKSPELTAKSDNPIVKALAWIKNGIVLIGNVAVAVAQKIVNFIIALKQISFKDILENISNFFANAKDWILTKIFGETEKEGKNLIDVLKKLTAAMKDWIAQLDLGTIVAGAFVISMIGVAGALAKLMNSASGLFGNASNLFKTVNNWIKKTYAKSVGILNIAEAFGILAASLWLLSKVPAEDLTRVAWTVGILIGALSGMYLLVAGITKLMMKGEKVAEIEKTFEALANVIRSVSFSIVAVAGAMLLLQNVELNKEMLGKLGLVVAAVGVLATIATGLSFLTQLTGKKKFFNIAQIISMTLGILAISLSLKKITSALVDLSSLTTEQVERATKSLVPLMIAFGALAMGAGQVKLTSVLALYLLIKLLEKVIPEIATLAEQTGALSNIALDTETLKGVVIAIAGIITLMGVFGKNISKATLGISMLMASLIAISLMFAKLNASGAVILSKQTAGILIAFGLLVISIEALAEKTKESKLIAFAGAMLLLVPVIASFGLIAWALKKLHLRWEDTIPLQVIMFGIGLLMTLAGDTKNTKISALIAIFAGLNGLFLEMIALSLIPYPKLLAAAVSMTLVMLGLSSLLKAISQIQRNNTIRDKGDFVKKIESLGLALLALAGVVGTMFAIYKVLSLMRGMDTKTMFASAIAISELLFAMSIITLGLSKIDPKGWNQTLQTLVLLGGLVGSMFVISMALQRMATIPMKQLDNVVWNFIKVLGTLTIAIGALAAIQAIPGVGKMGLAIALGVIAVALIGLCAAMAFATGKFKELANALTEIQNAVAGDPIGRVINQIIEGASVILNNSAAFQQNFHLIGQYIVDGLVSGINDNLHKAYQAGWELSSAAIKGTEDRASINSPSKVQYNNGVFMVLGMCGGILDNLGKAKASGAALALSSVEGTLDNAENAYKAGSFVGGATAEGYGDTVSTVSEIANTEMAETNEMVVGSIVEIEDEVTATTDRIEAQQESFWSNLGKSIENGLGQAAIAFDDFTGKVSAFFGGSGETWSAKIETGQTIKNNLKNMAKDPVGFLADTATKAYKSVTGDSGFSGFGDALSKIKDELGIGGNENYFEQIFGEDGGENLLENVSAGLSGVGSAAAQTKDVLASLKDTVEQQMDLFSEFNLETEMTAEDMLRNMSSQILGIQGWADNLTILAARGMDEGLLQMLGDLGPQAYEKVMAFAQMTDEQLAEANNMFRISRKLPGSAANQVFAGYTYAGEMAAKGFSHALDQYWGLIDPEVMGQKTIEDIAAGMTEYTHVVRTASGGAGSAAKDSFNDNAPDEKDGIEAMKKVALGIAGAGQDAVVQAIQQVRERVAEEERLLKEQLKNYNYSYSAVWSSLNGSNVSDRGFGNSKSGIGGEGLSDEAKKRLGIPLSDTVSISDEPVPKSATITTTPILNLSQIKAQAAELDNAFGVHEIQLAANGVDKRIEASRQMENRLLTEAFQTANKNTFDKFSRDVCAAITSTEKPVTVNVTLQGDAQEVFKMVRQENVRFTRINGYNALAT